MLHVADNFEEDEVTPDIIDGSSHDKVEYGGKTDVSTVAIKTASDFPTDDADVRKNTQSHLQSPSNMSDNSASLIGFND